MKKKIWYGFSARDNRTHFFDADPSGNADVGILVGTGSFSVDGTVTDLNIENVPQQAAGSRQRETA